MCGSWAYIFHYLCISRDHRCGPITPVSVTVAQNSESWRCAGYQCVGINQGQNIVDESLLQDLKSSPVCCHRVRDVMTSLEQCFMLEASLRLTFQTMYAIYSSGFTRKLLCLLTCC